MFSVHAFFNKFSCFLLTSIMTCQEKEFLKLGLMIRIRARVEKLSFTLKCDQKTVA